MYKAWKYFEKGSLMRATIARMKQLEYALYGNTSWFSMVLVK